MTAISLFHLSVTDSILLMGCGCMLAGAVYDIKMRIFPNWLWGLTLLIGIIYSYRQHFIAVALAMFLIINAIGIFFHKYNMMSAGDMKYISLFGLFINFSDVTSIAGVIVFLLISSVLVGVYYVIKKHRNLKEEAKNTYLQFRMWQVLKIPYQKKELKKEDSIPLTVPCTIAFFLWQLHFHIFT